MLPIAAIHARAIEHTLRTDEVNRHGWLQPLPPRVPRRVRPVSARASAAARCALAALATVALGRSMG